MGFVQNTFLIALAAVAAPLVLHLIFRRQTRQVQLGTIRFLTELLNENARRRRIKKWLLLSCRMLAMALLACAFARPYLLATQTRVSDRVVVLLVDRSASMTLRSQDGRPSERVASRAREILRGLGTNTRWELAFFDHRVEPLANEGRDGSTRNLELPGNLSGATDYGAAMAWARDLCVKAGEAPIDLYVLTDLQRSGLDWTSAEAFPPHVSLHIEDVGQSLVDNVAVTAALPSRTVVHPGDDLVVDVTLFNFGPMPHEDQPVSLTLSSTSRTQRMRDTVSLDPGQAGQLTFTVPGLTAGEWTGLVSIETEDQLQFDNQRHFFVLAAPPARVLLVDGSESTAEPLASTFYLEAALRLAPRGETFAESPFSPDVIRFAAAGIPALDDYDQVVLADVGGLSTAEAQSLGRFVRGGGGLLVFSGEQMTAESCAALEGAGLLPGRILGINRARALPFRWQTWNDSHPLFEPFRDPQFGDLRRLAFTAYTQFEPDPQATVLARYRDDAPALLDRRVGEGRVLWFTSSADRSWGDLPRSRLYVPLVHQMLGDLAGLTGGGPVRAVTLDADLAEDARFSPGVRQAGGRWHVVNTSPRESETDRCTPEEFAHRFGLRLPEVEAAPGRPLAAGALSVDVRDDEVWHWVVVALLVLLCGEAFLANRTTV